MLRYETYLFDLDGTLLDSIELIFRCYRHAAARHLPELPPDEVWRDGLGTPLRAQFRAVTDDPELIERMVVTYREFHHAHHDEAVRLFPGIEPVLASLAASKASLGVVTSKLRPGAERGLRLVGLVDRFDVIVTADDVERAKPDPEPVVEAVARLGTDRRATVFIGDSPHDIASGRAAGVATGAVGWGPFDEPTLRAARPDHFLATPEKILQL